MSIKETWKILRKMGGLQDKGGCILSFKKRQKKPGNVLDISNFLVRKLFAGGAQHVFVVARDLYLKKLKIILNLIL